jgi:hypothetical protein
MPDMKKDPCLGLAGACAAIGVLAAAVAGGTPAAQAKAQGFVCSTLSGVPTTLATMADGKAVPVIRWNSTVFDGAGWTPERRCQEVSARFDRFNRLGRLTYLTTGRINEQPVICTAPSNGAGCDGLLYTLKPGQNATETLRNLLEVRLKVRAPLYETNGRLYVSMEELLATPQSDGGGALPSASTLAPTTATPLF